MAEAITHIPAGYMKHVFIYLGAIKPAQSRGSELDGWLCHTRDTFSYLVERCEFQATFYQSIRQIRPFSGFPIADVALNFLFARQASHKEEYNRILRSTFGTLRLERGTGAPGTSEAEKQIVQAVQRAKRNTKSATDTSAIGLVILRDAATERRNATREDTPTPSDCSMRSNVSYMDADNPEDVPSSPVATRPTPIRLTPPPITPPPAPPATPPPPPRAIAPLPR